MKNITYFIVACIYISCQSNHTDTISKPLPLTTIDSERQCSSSSFTDSKLIKELDSVSIKYIESKESYKIPSNIISDLNLLKDRKHKDSVEYYNILGAYYITKGKYELAKTYLKRASNIDKSVSYTFNNLSIAYNNLEDHDKALSMLDIAEKLCPNKFSIIANKGYTLLKKGLLNE